jgi:hypothetical protein
VDEAVNRYARELIAAINAAVANDPAVRACRERAKAAGFNLEISLDAMVGVNDAPRSGGEGTAAAVLLPPRRQLPPTREFDITAADRRFLRSLRIAAEETEAR